MNESSTVYCSAEIVHGKWIYGRRPSSSRFYLATVEKNFTPQLMTFLHGCEIKSGRGRPEFEANMEVAIQNS